MPTTVNVSSNYAGSDAGRIIGETFKEADTIAKGLVTIRQNINYKENIRRIRYADGTAAYACGFTPAGTVTLNERVLETKKLKLDLEICKETFRQTWSDPSMGASAWNESPRDIEEAVIAQVLDSTAERTDYVIWNGDDSASQWEGFIPKFTADAAVIKDGNGITASGNPITSSTVLAEFAKVMTAIPVALRRKNLAWIVSPDVADAYVQYLIEKGSANGLGGNANTGLVYGRYNVEVVNALPDNTIIVYEIGNLFFGTGLLGDHNYIEAKDMDEVLLDGNVRFKMVYNGGVQYANSEDIVWYLSTGIPSV